MMSLHTKVKNPTHNTVYTDLTPGVCKANPGYSDILVSQQLSNLDVNASYALSFSLRYFFQSDPDVADMPTPTFTVSLDGIEVGDGSICTPGAAADGADAGCSTSNDGTNHYWNTFEPYHVSFFTANRG